MRASSDGSGKVGNGRRLRGRPCELLEDVRCPHCGQLRSAGSLIAWRGEEMCVRCSCEMLEAELHGAPADFRREARAMNDERRFARRREAAELAGETMVRDW